MNLREKAVEGVTWSAIKFWGGRAVPLVVLMILARLLEPKEFGLVALATAYTTFIQVFLEQGFASAIIQRKDLEREHLDSAFWITMAIGAVLTAIGVGTAGLAADLFDEPRVTPVVRVLSFNFLILSFQNVQFAILRRKLAFRSLALRSIGGMVVGGLVGVTLALSGAGVWSLVAQTMTDSLVGVVLLWRISDWRPGTKVSLRHARELWGFGINITGSRLLRYASTRSDQFLIGYFLGPVSLGFYAVGRKLYEYAVDLFTNVLSNVVFPVFSRVQSDPARVRRGFYTATQMGSLIIFPAFVGLAVTAPEVVRTLFGSRWEISIPLVQVLALLGLVEAVTYANNPLLLASGHPGWRLGIASAHAVVNLVAFFLAVRFGILAVAVAYTVRGYLLAPLELWAVHKAIGFDARTYFRQFRTPLAASAVMAAGVLALRSWAGVALGPVLFLAAAILLGAGIYLGVILLLERPMLHNAIALARLALPSRWRRARSGEEAVVVGISPDPDLDG